MANRLTLLAIALSVASLAIAVLGQVNPAPPCTDGIRQDNCTLPLCRCSGLDIPGNLENITIPQLVFLTFDDAVSVDNFAFYDETLFNRKNPNGEPITATFFITHEYTNYSMVHELWRRGHEIGLHSISHKSDVSYWKNLNATMWRQEVVDQREQLSQFARIPAGEVKGVRAPFLQPGGDTMYEVLSQARFQYDCSRPTLNYRAPGMWPYTNDYLSSQDCQIDPCPVGAYPGFWTVPMIDMVGGNGAGCAMVDTCTPYPETPQETFDLINRNFMEHYNGNRAPFGVFAHSAWMNGTEDDYITERRNGYVQFLDHLATMDDVYIVSITRALEWVKTPVPTANATDFAAFKVTVRPSSCQTTNRCHYRAEQTPFPTERFMDTCSACPNVYPWVGNHLGRPVNP